MSLSPDVLACAGIVEKGDPWRFRGAMAAPVAARAVLFPLYAFNVEVARAPWVTQEPMIAEMRLQWWRDVCEEIVEGRPVRRHEVATPLGEVIEGDDARLLDELVAARRWDIYKDAFEDEVHFADYMDKTAGNLMWVAARQLGPADESVVRDAAFGLGVAGWLAAIPALERAGRIPLLDGTTEGVARLAREAQGRLASARKGRGKVSKAACGALLHVGLADVVLAAAVKEPRTVAEGRLPDPVTVDWGLWWRALSGRW